MVLTLTTFCSEEPTYLWYRHPPESFMLLETKSPGGPQSKAHLFSLSQGQGLFGSGFGLIERTPNWDWGEIYFRSTELARWSCSARPLLKIVGVFHLVSPASRWEIHLVTNLIYGHLHVPASTLQASYYLPSFNYWVVRFLNYVLFLILFVTHREPAHRGGGIQIPKIKFSKCLQGC